MSSDNLVEVSGLHRHYGDLHAVRGIGFEVARGEVLGFLGPNGAGKSTTMQMLTGALAPSAGAIRIGGADLLERPTDAKAEIGYLPERPPLYRDLTVDEYLTFCARLRRVPGAQARGAVDEAKARCGLSKTGRRLVGNLSKGYQQRVGIAQAIVHRPAVVVLDEPTSGLDPNQIREIRDLVRELGGEHSVILSTHILPEVQSVCDRVLIMHLGELVMNETVSTLAEGLASPTGLATLRVSWHHPPDTQALAELDGVDRVAWLDEHTARLHHSHEADPTQEVVSASLANGWALCELVQERRTLEEIFVELTCGDESSTSDDGSQPVASSSADEVETEST